MKDFKQWSSKAGIFLYTNKQTITIKEKTKTQRFKQDTTFIAVFPDVPTLDYISFPMICAHTLWHWSCWIVIFISYLLVYLSNQTISSLSTGTNFLHIQHLKQYLLDGQPLINICRINEWPIMHSNGVRRHEMFSYGTDWMILLLSNMNTGGRLFVFQCKMLVILSTHLDAIMKNYHLWLSLCFGNNYNPLSPIVLITILWGGRFSFYFNNNMAMQNCMLKEVK